MNHLSEWKRIYHPRSGKFIYKHKGTGVITDSLFKIGKTLKKPLIGALKKKTGKNVAEKGTNKASVIVKIAGDNIGNILRKRSSKAGSQSRPTSAANTMVRLNQLIASL